MVDKYSALWVSHSSINDFLCCPRLYYLKNVYHSSETGHKVGLMTPSLALGQVIHGVLEEVSSLPREKRFEKPLWDRFERLWQEVSGEKGGFFTAEEEKKYKARGKKMIERVIKNPGPLKKLAVKIKEDLPYFWLSEKEGIILCGKIDWLEYRPEEETVHIIDFKTGRSKELVDSLQLPIYALLASVCQEHSIEQASYWYLEYNDRPTPIDLPTESETKREVLEVAKKIKLARRMERFQCSKGKNGCRYCQPYEKIIAGEAQKVGLGKYGNDIFVLPPKKEKLTDSKIF